MSPNDVGDDRVDDRLPYNARRTYYANIQNRYVERFAASYVTGSHTFKTGFQLQQGSIRASRKSTRT